MWYVYVLQSINVKFASSNRNGPTYVGSTTDPVRRLKEHNGELPSTNHFIAKLKPWKPVALFGPYETKEEALEAEASIQKLKGSERMYWDGKGDGTESSWVKDPTQNPY